tara:strand:- start:555 stop:1064 length:510 start_codon:yes stop_codon:yes gene_type:complete
MEYQLNLKILSNNQDVINYYKNFKLSNDSGVDLIIPDDAQVSIFNTYTIDHKVQCSMFKIDRTTGEKETCGYWLLPRSSISKTNIRMANSVGLIDSGYRGNIKAKVDMKPQYTITNHNIEVVNAKTSIQKYSRLFQIAAPDMTPISKINIVSTLDLTERGTGGFGSTGR